MQSNKEHPYRKGIESFIGELIDERYHVSDFLGMGGMGAAFRAKQVDLNRDVCLKFLKYDSLTDLESIARFKREAKALAGLQHPNIVRCYSFGVFENIYPYLVLEYVDGQALNNFIQGNPMDWRLACVLISQVCDALTVIHKAGYVHRDVKPANVMISTTNGKHTAKLLDFGLVGKSGEVQAAFDTLTDPRSVMGTPNYMAPECFTGSDTGPIVDAYAVGCMLYELLSGQHPFDAENSVAIMYKHINEKLPKLPANNVPNSVRNTLEELIWSATNVDPRQRPKSCEAIKVRLLKILDLEQPVVNELSTATDQQGALSANGPKQDRAGNGPGYRTLLLIVAVIAILCASAPKLTRRSSSAARGIDLVNGLTSQTKSLSMADELNALAKEVNINCSSAKGSDGRLDQEFIEERTRSCIRKVRTFLENFANTIDTADSTQKWRGSVELLFAALSKLQSSLTESSSLQSELLGLKCDLLTSFGFYSDTRQILKARNEHSKTPVMPSFRPGDSGDLAQLDDYVFRDTTTDEFETRRLRPAAKYYPLLKRADNSRFLRLLEASHYKDTWKPKLSEIAKQIKTNESEMARLSISLAAIAVEDGDFNTASVLLAENHPALATNKLAQLDNVAGILERCGQGDEALKRLRSGCRNAELRGDDNLWCHLKCNAIRTLKNLGRTSAAQSEFMSLQGSVHWKRIWSKFELEPVYPWTNVVQRVFTAANDVDDFEAISHLYNAAEHLCKNSPEEIGFYREIGRGYIQTLLKRKLLEDAKRVIANELRRCGSESERLGLAISLCELADSRNASESDLAMQMRINGEWALGNALRRCNASNTSPEEIRRGKDMWLHTNLCLADSYGARALPAKAIELNERALEGAFGELSQRTRIDLLLKNSRYHRDLGNIDKTLQLQEKVIEELLNQPCWMKSDYRRFADTVYELAATDANYGAWRTAVPFLKSKLALLKPNSDKYCFLCAVLFQASNWGHNEDPDTALHYLTLAESSLKSLPQPEPESVEFRAQVRRAVFMGEGCLFLLERAVSNEKELFTMYVAGDLERVDLLCELADLYQLTGNLKEASLSLSQADAQPVDIRDRAARIAWRQSLLESNQHHFLEARRKLVDASKILDKIEDADGRTIQQLSVELALARIDLWQEHYDDAYARLMHALPMVHSTSSKTRFIIGVQAYDSFYTYLSASLEGQGKAGQARKALEVLCGKMQEPLFLHKFGQNACSHVSGYALYRLGKLCRRQHDDRAALSYLTQAVSCRRGNHYLRELAEVIAKVQGHEEARAAYARALEKVDSIRCNAPLTNLEKGETYLSYACWLHDCGDCTRARAFGSLALSNLRANPAICFRFTQKNWSPGDRSSLRENLRRVLKWCSSSEREEWQDILNEVQESLEAE